MKRGSAQPASQQGPFRADQLQSGDSYELSHGHPVRCLPTGGRGSKATSVGDRVLASDPAVRDVGVDTGFTPAPDTLRAPDLSVADIPDQPGWVRGAPPLAVEYADTGQDEVELAAKIEDLLAAGTRYIWVVRLTGPRRVEIHEPGKKVRVAHPGEELQAPGILDNPVSVEALYDGDLGWEVVFRNLLQRRGYENLEAVVAQGEVQGLQKAILGVLTARGLIVDDAFRAALKDEIDVEALESLLSRAATAASVDELLPPID